MQNRTKFFEEYNFLKSSKLVKYIIFKYKLNTEYTVCKNFNVDNSYKIQPHMNEDISIIYCGSNIFGNVLSNEKISLPCAGNISFVNALYLTVPPAFKLLKASQALPAYKLGLYCCNILVMNFEHSVPPGFIKPVTSVFDFNLEQTSLGNVIQFICPVVPAVFVVSVVCFVVSPDTPIVGLLDVKPGPVIG